MYTNRPTVHWRYIVTQTEAEGPEYAMYKIEGMPEWVRWDFEEEPPADVMEHFHGPVHGREKPEAPMGRHQFPPEVEVIAIALQKFEEDWILYVEPHNRLMMLNEAYLVLYGNLSNPNSDSLEPGHVIGLPPITADKLIEVDIYELWSTGIYGYDRSHWAKDGENRMYMNRPAVWEAQDV